MKYNWKYYFLTMSFIALVFILGSVMTVLAYNIHPMFGVIVFLLFPIRWSINLIIASYL